MRTMTPHYTYKIVTGDTLHQIAVEFGSCVDELMHLNPHIANSNLIYPGQELKMPQHCIQKWLASRGINSPAILANKCVEMSNTIADLRLQVEGLLKEKEESFDGFKRQGRRLYELCVLAGAHPGGVKYWLADLLEKLDRPVPNPDGYQLVPKMLTTPMANKIRDGAANQRFASWPANCWEGAIEVAPVPLVSLRKALGLQPSKMAKIMPVTDCKIELLVDGKAIPIDAMTSLEDDGQEPMRKSHALNDEQKRDFIRKFLEGN